MTGQELAVRTQEIVAQLNHPAFLEQVEESLPENVSLQRFVRIASTAIRSNPDFLTADQTSLFAAIVKCAQDGLYPDGRDAALVLYKGKVGYIPMISGFRKIAAEHGWAIKTSVVYENDEFEYTEEPPNIVHRPVRPGRERGNLVAAYAVATSSDGRRMQTVLHPEDIAKRRKIAQTDLVWSQWEPQMWEKTAGRDLFGQLPLAEGDRERLARMYDQLQPGDAAAAMYGEQARDVFDGAEVLDTETGELTPGPTQAEEPGTGGVDGQQPQSHADQAEADGRNDGDASPDPANAELEADLIVAGAMVAPDDQHPVAAGKPVSAIEDDEYLLWALSPRRFWAPTERDYVAALKLWTEHRNPELWARAQAASTADQAGG